MKKVFTIVLVVAMLMMLAGSVSAKPMMSRASDERDIQRLVLKKECITPDLRVKFSPIRFVDSWAKVCYPTIYWRDDKGKEMPPHFSGDQMDMAQFLLTKRNGKWQLMIKYVEGVLPSECRKIGLPMTTASELGITVFKVAAGDEARQIERSVLDADRTILSGQKVKFNPIKLSDGWANASYSSDVTSVLKKSGGKWRRVYTTGQDAISLKDCKRVGILPQTARKIGLQIGER